jgi:hypothetical protein
MSNELACSFCAEAQSRPHRHTPALNGYVIPDLDAAKLPAHRGCGWLAGFLTYSWFTFGALVPDYYRQQSYMTYQITLPANANQK